VARISTPKITFDSAPTVDEAIEALQELREMAGGDATLRVTGRIEVNLNGPRVASMCAESAQPR